jgi:gliding motility-associated protein GldC
MAVSNKSKIIIDVSLDENKVPEKLHWSAKDGGVENQEAKAMLLSVWDAKSKESMRIDLWTKDMPLDEMKIFFHQTLSAMSDTFSRATNDEKMTATMKDFCDYFAEKLDLHHCLHPLIYHLVWSYMMLQIS